ncbi:MAG: hypothetical protein U0798_14485 [Gemmataceae bacterium]
MTKHAARKFAFFAVLFTLTCCGTLNAQTWNGTTGNWLDASMWTGGVPVSSATTALTFNGNSIFTSTNNLSDNPFELNQLNLSGTGTGTNIIQGGLLRFTGTSPTINNTVTFNQRYDIMSDIEFATNTSLNMGNDNVILSGRLSGSGNLELSQTYGEYALYLKGNATSTLSGNIISNGVSILADNDSRLGLSQITLKNSGSLEMTNSTTTSRTITTSSSAFLMCNNDTNWTIDGKITGTGDINIHGSGTIILSNSSNDYIGQTSLTGGGTVKLGSSTALPSNTDLSLTSSTFDTNGYSTSIQSINNRGAIINSGTSITIGGGSFTWGGSMSGDGSLIKNGPGNFFTSTGSTYTGGTIISDGAFYANNSTGSATGTGNVTINSSGTLGGKGFIDGKVTGNGTITGSSNINSIGRLTLNGGLDLSTGGKYLWDLGALSESNAGTDFDQISIAGGDLTLGGSSKLTLDFGALGVNPNLSNAFWDSPHTWTIIDVNSPGTNSFNNTFSEITNPTYSTGSFTLLDPTINGGDIVLSFTPNPVPEPAFILTATILGAIGGQVLRKRSKGKQSD